MGHSLPRPKRTVDLHAEEFLKSNIDQFEIEELLGETILYFRRQLDAAIYWDYPEIRFIHGKGSGMLKRTIYEELKSYKEMGLIAKYYPAYHNEDIVVVLIGI